MAKLGYFWEMTSDGECLLMDLFLPPHCNQHGRSLQADVPKDEVDGVHGVLSVRGAVHCVLQDAFGKAGSQGVRADLFSLLWVNWPHHLPPLSDGVLFTQNHHHRWTSAHKTPEHVP